MMTYQHDALGSVGAHSQAETGALRLVVEFNDRELREYQARRDRILKMLDDSETLLRADRELKLSGNDA